MYAMFSELNGELKYLGSFVAQDRARGAIKIQGEWFRKRDGLPAKEGTSRRYIRREDALSERERALVALGPIGVVQ